MTGIGSPSWFAGVWWLVVGVLIHALACFLVRFDCCLWACWPLADWSDKCAALALECAKEGGMTE